MRVEVSENLVERGPRSFTLTCILRPSEYTITSQMANPIGCPVPPAPTQRASMVATDG